MQNDETVVNNEGTNEIKTVEINQENQTAAMTGQSVSENTQVSTSQSFGLEVSCSDDDEVSEVDSFIIDTEEQDPSMSSNFLLPQRMEGANLHTLTVDAETNVKLEALLEAAGIGKWSTPDGKTLTDPEVLRKLTSSVSCALDDAAQALHRMRAEQQSQLGNPDSQRSLAEACSDGDVKTVQKLLDEGGSVHETTDEGDSLLSLACSAGYYELAQVLLAMKANVEDRGIKGDCTPLMEAASGGYVDIVKLLIVYGAEVNAQSSAGNTPLHYAACGGYEDVVQVLIEAGANVEQHNENGHTPLMEAASAGHVGVASILLNNGAGINTHSNEFKESALTLACYKGHLEMVKFLLEAGADQEHKTDEMHTALMEASMDGHVEVAKLLLDSGAQVNMPADSFESPLTLAACGGHVELANLLIERGANLEEVNDEGYTPLMEAAREGHEEMVALLLAHDADINAQTEETQETALTLACCGGFLDVADFLISAGADIELGCSTPLMEAAQEGHYELVKYLLKAKADVNATTGTGDTALTYACENGHTDVADVLLDHGAELEHESEGGRTPLMKAARAGHLCTVQFLISREPGADVNRQTTSNDHTVLSLACAGGHLAVVELLLTFEADPTHKLKDGSTMVIEAAKGGHTNVVKLLLEYPNRVLMNHGQDLPQITADSHLESRVPIHGLVNIVPPSEPDSLGQRTNNLTTTTCEHLDGASPTKRKAQDRDMNNPAKLLGDQVLQNMQKSLKKLGAGNQHNVDQATKTSKTSNLSTPGDLVAQINENGVISDLLPEETIDLKAGERLEAIISNIMPKDLINTANTREEQILRKQQILEELQKVEKELQEKAQQQLLITAQHQQQQQQQLQQVLQSSRQPLHQVLQKQPLDKKKSSSQAVTLSSTSDLPELPMSNNLDKQATRSVNAETSKSNIKPNISESVTTKITGNNEGKAVVPPPSDGNVGEKPKSNNGQNGSSSSNQGDKSKSSNGGSDSSEKGSCANGNTASRTNGQTASSNGPVQSHNGVSQSSTSQPSRPPLPNPNQLITQFPTMPPAHSPTIIPLSQTTATPVNQLTISQQQQLDQQFQQFQQQTIQQTVLNQQLVLNENQRQTLQNLIIRQSQEAQQLAQQSSLPYTQLQVPTQHYENLRQVLAQQPCTTQQVQQQQQFAAITSQQPAQVPPSLLQQTAALNPNFSQVLFNQQQQQQLLQQQTQALILQQQQQMQIKQPVPTTQAQKAIPQRKTKSLLPVPQISPEHPGMLGIETVTPPPSTPLTPNPSPASPDSISPLYTPIDLDAQTESNHDTALTLACAGGHAELVTLLLTKGADIEHRDKKGFTPLILAATAGHTEVVEILLENGADIEAQSERTKDTPLSLACSGGRYEVVELLLCRGANKEHRNVSDYTPLSLAASGGFVNIIKLLLSHGAEINSRTGSKLGISPLMLAAMNGHTAAVKLLLDMGSDINAQIETNRNTALTLACFQGRHEVVSLLVDRRATIEHRAKTGLTPLMEAASGGYVEVGRVLLDKGADVNAPPVPSSRDTALTIAADKGHYRFVELLLSRSAAVDVKNKKGNSPLWLACNGGHLDVVQLLVTAKADIDSQDNRKVSCLMAAFRKGHVKVVKWMVKHVNQFPSDTELSRYIATVTDKELQKKCQQCMEIIVSAKDRQAAEANKNATDLLEILDKERQEEESRRAAAAKKREKKKKKKKQKQESTSKDEEKDSNSKNSTPEPESEDFQPREMEVEVKDKTEEKQLVIQPPPMATTTSTLGLTIPTSTEPVYAKPKARSQKSEKRNSKNDSEVNNMEDDRLGQDENKDPRDNKLEKKDNSVALRNNNNKADTPSRTESKKNKKNKRDRGIESSSSIDKPPSPETERVPGMNQKKMADEIIAKGRASTALGKKKKGEKDINSAIGDLDDFGNLPSISDKDIERLRKVKLSHVEKTPYEKAQSEVNSPSMLSVKTSQSLVNSPKRGQKKEDGWKEVIRKSKKVQVPASAISRVIGRGGSNINAIREVSGANIDVEKNKGSGDRTITIKGSAEATRQAHALITALITDPDKELNEIIPKAKQKPAPAENKSLYFILPDSPQPSVNQQSGSSSLQKSTNKMLAPRLQQQAQQQQQVANTAIMSSRAGTVTSSQNMVWGSSPTIGAVSPRRIMGKPHGGAPYSVPSASMNGPVMGDKSQVSRQLFVVDATSKRMGFGPPPGSVTTMASMPSSGPTPASPQQFTIRPDVRLPHPRAGNPNKLVPGSVKVLQRPNVIGQGKPEPQPLPIVSNQSTTTITTQTVSSANNSLNMSGEFSPFGNFFSNDFLGKKEDLNNERMNFASVAAQGVVSSIAGQTVMSPEPNSPDPALQAKAPGFKMQVGASPRMSTPQDPRIPGFPLPSQIIDITQLQAFHGLSGFQGVIPQPFNNQSPNMSPRSSQNSSAGLSPRSSNSGFDPQLNPSQKQEYTMPNQPMTLPKISSSLNPNAPDFTSRSMANSSPFQGNQAPPIYPTAGDMSQLNNLELAKLVAGQVGNPQNQSPSTNSFFQNVAKLMHGNPFEMYNNMNPGSPGLGGSFNAPNDPFSTIPGQGRPSSAPSVAGMMPKDGPSPTPIGPQRSTSPMASSTPPMPELLHNQGGLDDRRQVLPIGGERMQRKGPGSMMPSPNDFSEPLWGFQPDLNMQWTPKIGSPVLTTIASIQSTVTATSVIAGSTMSTNPISVVGEKQGMNLDGGSPVQCDEMSDQSFNQFVPSSGLPPMPLFNGVGPYHTPGFGNNTGDNLGGMWSSPVDAPKPDDMQDSGMWNNWNKME